MISLEFLSVFSTITSMLATHITMYLLILILLFISPILFNKKTINISTMLSKQQFLDILCIFILIV